MQIAWARLAKFCHLGLINDPLIVSKFHNETHYPKGQENTIYTIVKGKFIIPYQKEEYDTLWIWTTDLKQTVATTT